MPTLFINRDKYTDGWSCQPDPHIGDGTDARPWEVIDGKGDHVVTRPNREQAESLVYCVNHNIEYVSYNQYPDPIPTVIRSR